MKLFAFLISCLCFAVPVAHATNINPLDDGFKFIAGNTAVTKANATFSPITGVLSFSDGTATYTFAEISAAPLVDGLSVTRTCVTVDLAGCSSTILSVSNAAFLNGLFQTSAAVGVSVQASATAGVSNLVFAHSTAAVGAQSALGGYSATAVAPTPEPSSLALLGTGLLGIAGVIRRRLA